MEDKSPTDKELMIQGQVMLMQTQMVTQQQIIDKLMSQNDALVRALVDLSLGLAKYQPVPSSNAGAVDIEIPELEVKHISPPPSFNPFANMAPEDKELLRGFMNVLPEAMKSKEKMDKEREEEQKEWKKKFDTKQ